MLNGKLTVNIDKWFNGFFLYLCSRATDSIQALLLSRSRLQNDRNRSFPVILRSIATNVSEICRYNEQTNKMNRKVLIYPLIDSMAQLQINRFFTPLRSVQNDRSRNFSVILRNAATNVSEICHYDEQTNKMNRKVLIYPLIDLMAQLQINRFFTPLRSIQNDRSRNFSVILRSKATNVSEICRYNEQTNKINHKC